MALGPALAKTVAAACVKYQEEPPRGIIPLQPLEIDSRSALIYEVAEIITGALTGPAICVLELAEMIVDTVRETA
ncbi:hypothetical protein [Mesorhizobium sp.]|uniref:hypothetical protein n=1 Tax=Mesorhizobium sp. TaxID=1871066 RepID=UPI000FE8A04E|nr:hypothetical protein [Mesorhizobium sp.]RWI22037.1 MAG: hypothetical protein EOQ92_18750 [Mesorhizobium sp.]RWK46084.1 MAG: hypothetical protein EOR47_27650 [Mesorhizobium sp.]RWK47662.1 MAG: hypothetical protein EOR45_38270 [Mesorhizobium sp.]RWK92323.1 MAG: hypothetical protein EOR53_26780 [Mesorhizobium sp.]TIP57773.1 MAG: hypothetical protein E5X56_18440 [Mesorhizobium sp.]